MSKSIGDYVVTDKIGSGAFAQVYKAYHKTSRLEVAVKAISRKRLNKKLQENLEQEISILRNFQHRNIVKLYEIKKTENHIYLLLEYCGGGDLHKFIKKTGSLTEATSRHFMAQLAAGLKFLWSKNVIHRDLKPQNLLLTAEDANATLQIADFGFAKHLEVQNLAETLCGSPLYMAPEILQFQKYDAKADLWSVGTILFEMLVGRPPFNGANHIELLATIERSELRVPDDVQISPSALHLLQILLKRNPVERVSFELFFAHDFVQSLPKRAEITATSTNDKQGHVGDTNSSMRASGDVAQASVDPRRRNKIMSPMASPLLTPQAHLMPPPMSLDGDEGGGWVGDGGDPGTQLQQHQQHQTVEPRPRTRSGSGSSGSGSGGSAYGLGLGLGLARLGLARSPKLGAMGMPAMNSQAQLHFQQSQSHSQTPNQAQQASSSLSPQLMPAQPQSTYNLQPHPYPHAQAPARRNSAEPKLQQQHSQHMLAPHIRQRSPTCPAGVGGGTVPSVPKIDLAAMPASSASSLPPKPHPHHHPHPHSNPHPHPHLHSQARTHQQMRARGVHGGHAHMHGRIADNQNLEGSDDFVIVGDDIRSSNNSHDSSSIRNSNSGRNNSCDSNAQASHGDHSPMQYSDVHQQQQQRHHHHQQPGQPHPHASDLAATLARVEVLQKRAVATKKLGDQLSLAASAATNQYSNSHSGSNSGSNDSHVSNSGSNSSGKSAILTGNMLLSSAHSLGANSESSSKDSVELNGTDSDKTLFAEAAMVYMKALLLFQSAVAVARAGFHHPCAGATGSNLQAQARLAKFHAELGQQFLSCLGTAEACRSRVAQGTATACVEQLMYTHALQLSRDAAVKELLGQRSDCIAQYSWGQTLLEAVHEHPTLSGNDRASVEQFVNLLGARLKHLKSS